MTPSLGDYLAEAATASPPDTVDLDAAVSAGQRRLRHRRAARAGGSVLLVAGCAALALQGLQHDGAARPSVQVATQRPVSDDPTSRPMATTEPIDAAGIAWLVTERLPSFGITGRPSIEVIDDERRLVRFVVDTPEGRGMFQVSVDSSDVLRDSGSLKELDGKAGVTLRSDRTRPDGTRVVVLGNDTNCVQTTSVWVEDPGTRTLLTLDASTCLPFAAGRNQAAPAVLTAEQAEALLTTSGVSSYVHPAVNDAGAALVGR